MGLTTAFWYAAGIIAALVLLQLFARQLEMLLRVLGNSIVGGIALWLLNAVGGQVGFHLALNPVTAGITGLLGVPGLISLVLMRRILG
ncbi:MAG TPA: pro-sigmaK processing inhibitor BofA family protein [Symbiobacteriaceae bacterium]|nr:pro-sigmaK processing inhibitor BofA family protein [Symbiobacteriaceae bacterium]